MIIITINDLGNFQNGVDTIYNGCTTYGSTPTASTPNAIVTAISNIYTNRYNSGRTQGRSDVTSSPNSYSLYTKAQYDAHYNDGRTQTHTEYLNDLRNALAYSGLGITSSTSWSTIISTLKAKYPAYYDVLASFTSSNWSVSTTGSYGYTYTPNSKLYAAGGTYNGGHFDGTITIYSTKIDVSSFSKLITTFSKNYDGYSGVPIYKLIASNGEKSLSSGTNNISSLTGQAQLYVYVKSGRNPNNSALTVASITITQIRFEA